jgi:hypothetical protein
MAKDQYQSRRAKAAVGGRGVGYKPAWADVALAKSAKPHRYDVLPAPLGKARDHPTCEGDLYRNSGVIIHYR